MPPTKAPAKPRPKPRPKALATLPMFAALDSRGAAGPADPADPADDGEPMRRTPDDLPPLELDPDAIAAGVNGTADAPQPGAGSGPSGAWLDQWDGLHRAAVVSFWYKSLRLGDAEGAFAGTWLLTYRFKVGVPYVLERLVGLVGEDCAPEEACRLLPFLGELQRLATAGVSGGYSEKTGKAYKAVLGDAGNGGFLFHYLAHATYLVATARKWYMSNAGAELEEIRQQWVEKRETETAKAFRLPQWTHDAHTAVGKRRIEEGTADLRMDGRFLMRVGLRARWSAFVHQWLAEHANTAFDFDAARRAWVAMNYETAEFERRPGYPPRKRGKGVRATRDAGAAGPTGTRYVPTEPDATIPRGKRREAFPALETVPPPNEF